jgi:hypothetical protein
LGLSAFGINGGDTECDDAPKGRVGCGVQVSEPVKGCEGEDRQQQDECRGEVGAVVLENSAMMARGYAGLARRWLRQLMNLELAVLPPAEEEDQLEATVPRLL